MIMFKINHPILDGYHLYSIYTSQKMDLLIASKYHSMWGKLAVRREHPNTWQFVNTDQHRWRQPRDLVSASAHCWKDVDKRMLHASCFGNAPDILPGIDRDRLAENPCPPPL
jgi:hypothetical protein